MKTSEGEMLWYESARLAHGRPKPLQGKMYVIGSCVGDDDLFVMLIRVREDLPKNTRSSDRGPPLSELLKTSFQRLISSYN